MVRIHFWIHFQFSECLAVPGSHLPPCPSTEVSCWELRIGLLSPTQWKERELKSRVDLCTTGYVCWEVRCISGDLWPETAEKVISIGFTKPSLHVEHFLFGRETHRGQGRDRNMVWQRKIWWRRSRVWWQR